MSLSASAVSELSVEKDIETIFHEWLSLWFNGNSHAVGSNPATVFPKANIAFGQVAADQPLDQGDGFVGEIRLVLLPRQENQEGNSESQTDKLAICGYLLNFFVHSKSTGKGKAEYHARQLADLLKAILSNPTARGDLAEKGISRLQPLPSRHTPSAEYATRLVSCNARINYVIKP
jgi:hypothetical protein